MAVFKYAIVISLKTFYNFVHEDGHVGRNMLYYIVSN